MLTDFARDHAFTIAWFGLMAMVWFGWGQEDPPRRWRVGLGIGSVFGILLLGLFGYGVIQRWNDGTALEGRYPWFGLLVLIEVLAAGIGCLILWRRRQSRWMAWWVGLVVAAHFVPLAFLLNDVSLVGLGLLQMIALLIAAPRLSSLQAPTSRYVGPIMGVSLLAFALASVIVFIATIGAPW